MAGSRIEWCDATYNPITGCRHGCAYCYAKKIAQRFSGNVRRNKLATADYDEETGPYGTIYTLKNEMVSETGQRIVYPFGFEPTYYPDRTATLDRYKRGAKIFVGAMADIFGEWVPDRIIREIFDTCRSRPQNRYIFLTKNPARYGKLIVPDEDNFWYGTTVTGPDDMDRVDMLPSERHTFVCIEPILKPLSAGDVERIAERVEWIILGALTGTGKKVAPDARFLRNVVLTADEFNVPVFMKNSLADIAEDFRTDMPAILNAKRYSPKMDEILFDICYGCGKKNRKSKMITLLAKSARRESPKTFAFLCRDCFVRECESLGCEVPELEVLR